MRSAKFFYTVLFCTPFLAFADAVDYQKVESWLHKMHHAAHMSNYVGTFVYQQDKQLSAMKIIHAANELGERERLVSLDNSGREIIRKENRVICILPDSKSVVVEKGRPDAKFPPAFPMSLEHLQHQYSFVLEKIEQVAGQRAQKIVIKPNDNLRYGHRLWVDADSGLLLKSHLIDDKGRLVEQFMFTQIKFLNEVPDEMLEPQEIGKEFVWYEAAREEAEKNQAANNSATDDKAVSRWKVRRLPAGFSEDMQRQHQMPDSKSSIEHLVFSDGLASVSVFIEKHQNKPDNLVGGSRLGAINAYGRQLDKYHVTVVGEVPQITVKRICESVVAK